MILLSTIESQQDFLLGPLTGFYPRSRYELAPPEDRQLVSGGTECVLAAGCSDYRSHATSEAEAYHMIDAGEHIRRALAEQGYAPR